jgi:peptidoglycan/LPS O-acetylase OafA/YrhL
VITGLTSLRGIAALLVVLFHFNMFIANLVPISAQHIVSKLYLMVDLFFVLSGFVLFHAYGRDPLAQKSWFGFKRFCIARFARIYPMHIFSLFLVVILFGVMWKTQTFNNMFEVTYNPNALLPQILLIHALGMFSEATWNSPSWSISVEWWVYMCFPALVFLLFKGKQWARYLIWGLIIIGYLAIIFYYQPEFWNARWALYGVPESVPIPLYMLDVTTGGAFLRCLCGFMLGMLIYDYYVRFKTNTFLASGWWSLITCLLLLVGWSYQQLNDIVAVLIMATLILNIALNQGRLVKILEYSVFKNLGNISYSVYLMHMPIIFAYIGIRRIFIPEDPDELMLGYAMSLNQSWLLFSIMLAVIIALSLMTYRYIELPFGKYLKRSTKDTALE